MLMRVAFVALLLFLPLRAFAAPITIGVWSPAPTADNDGFPFWDGLSWDGPALAVGHLIDPGLEYLHDGAGQPVAFAFDDVTIDWTLLYSITAWTGGTLGRNALGAWTYDSGTGRLSDSLTAPGQYALFRSGTNYVLGIEDILLSETLNDRDHNDYVVAFESVPEPTLLLLLGAGLVGVAWRRRRG